MASDIKGGKSTGGLPVVIIAAVAQNGVIGINGDMPWRLSSDLVRFKSITMGNPIIMGRKTFESIGKLLACRHTIIVTRNAAYQFEGAQVVASLELALAAARGWAMKNGAKEICIIGGGEIYRQSRDLADKLYLTEVKASPQGDTYFAPIDRSSWHVEHEEQVPAGAKDSCETRFVIYRRN